MKIKHRNKINTLGIIYVDLNEDLEYNYIINVKVFINTMEYLINNKE